MHYFSCYFFTPSFDDAARRASADAMLPLFTLMF